MFVDLVLQHFPVPDSKLNPRLTHEAGLTRWVAVPVYKETNTLQLRPDGLLVKGDLISGKTGAMER